MGFKQEALRRHPAPGQTQEGGLPTLPNRPRTPHIPHARALAMGIALTLAGTAAAASLEQASQTLAQTQTDPRTNLVPAEQMRYPWDSGNVYINLNWRDAGEGNMVLDGASLTSDPQIYQKDEDTFVVNVLGEEYGPADYDYGHLEVNLINDVMKGGIWEKEVDAEGNPILDAEGKPILHHFMYKEPIADQAQEPINS